VEHDLDALFRQHWPTTTDSRPQLPRQLATGPPSNHAVARTTHKLCHIYEQLHVTV